MCLSLLEDLKGRKKIEATDNIRNSFISKRLQMYSVHYLILKLLGIIFAFVMTTCIVLIPLCKEAS